MNHESGRPSAVDFETWWSREAQLLDSPNRRGAGTSSVAVVEARDWPEFGLVGRLYVKRQQAFFCRPSWNAFRRTPTLRREARFIARARELGMNVPEVVCYMEAPVDRALLVLRGVDRTNDLERAVPSGGSRRAEVFEHLGKMLAKLHAVRIMHGAIYPKHVLVEVDAPHRVWLIDFEKARRVASRSSAAERDIARLRRHAPFMTDADLEALLRGYDPRAFPGLVERLRTAER